MTGWWQRQALKRRLALWYAATIFATLAILGPIAYVTIEQRLHSVIDRQLAIDLSLFEGALVADADGSVRWTAPDESDAATSAARYAWFEVWSAEGQLLLRSRSKGSPHPPSILGDPYTVHLETGDEARVLERAISRPRAGLVLRVYRDEAGLHTTLRQILIAFALAAPFAAMLAAGGGFVLARRALAPIAEMADSARRITSESLATRFEQPNPHDELGELASVFNETLDRLERSFAELHRFTADASHELRTPLTALRAVGEIGLRQARDVESLQQVVASMLEESGKLDDIVETLLVLARGEAERAALELAVVDVGSLLDEARERLEVLAEERGQTIRVDCKPGLMVRGDRQRLLLALTNLLHNAIRYSPPGSPIEIRGTGQDLVVWIEVVDRGPGIAREFRERIFERFFRTDDARSRGEGGSGLGLALVKLFVEQQGGTIAVQSEEGSGSTFCIVLPSAAV